MTVREWRRGRGMAAICLLIVPLGIAQAQTASCRFMGTVNATSGETPTVKVGDPVTGEITYDLQAERVSDEFDERTGYSVYEDTGERTRLVVNTAGGTRFWSNGSGAEPIRADIRTSRYLNYGVSQMIGSRDVVVEEADGGTRSGQSAEAIVVTAYYENPKTLSIEKPAAVLNLCGSGVADSMRVMVMGSDFNFSAFVEKIVDDGASRLPKQTGPVLIIPTLPLELSTFKEIGQFGLNYRIAVHPDYEAQYPASELRVDSWVTIGWPNGVVQTSGNPVIRGTTASGQAFQNQEFVVITEYMPAGEYDITIHAVVFEAEIGHDPAALEESATYRSLTLQVTKEPFTAE